MNPALVLDSSALLAITLLEPGGEYVLSQIQNAPSDVLVHAVNVFEIAYKLMVRGVSEAAAWEAATFGGIEIIDDTGEGITKRAIRLKVANLHLSMGDCYCMALAESTQGTVLTGDKGFAKAKSTTAVVLFRE